MFKQEHPSAFSSFEDKVLKLQNEFSHASGTPFSQEAIYLKIIELGKKLPIFEPAWKQEANLVQGCQSLLYLHVLNDGTCLRFYAYSDALISAGLAALLISLYDGEPFEQILKNPPHILETIGIPVALSPNRANGLASLYKKMREEAIKAIVKKSFPR